MLPATSQPTLVAYSPHPVNTRRPEAPVALGGALAGGAVAQRVAVAKGAGGF